MFCELNFMSELIYLASAAFNRDINLQIIKSFAALILTIKNKGCLYYICSNNFINQIISNNFEKYDEDFLSYYVNFLKSLALKIDMTTIQFFFFKDRNSFPLLENTLKLYNHPDSMIKNVVRNIYLKLCKMNYEPIYKYLCSLPSISYFAFIACRLRDLTISVDRAAFGYTEHNKFDYQSFKSAHDDLVDEILYLQDIFSLNLEKINSILINSLMYYYILPLLFDSIIIQRDFKTYEKKLISPQLAMYILSLMIKSIKNESMINVVVYLLYSKKINREILQSFIYSKHRSPSNYYFEWKDQKKNLNVSFSLYITYNFSPSFIVSLITMNNSPYKEIRQLVKEYEEIFRTVPNFDPRTNENSIKIIKSVLQKIDYDIQRFTSYHAEISDATGIRVGMNTNKEESLLTVLKKSETSNDVFMVDNPIRNNLIDVFLRSTDEVCILMVNVMIDIILNKTELSKIVLASCNLLRCTEWNEVQVSNSYKTFNPNKDLLDIFGGVSLNNNNTQKEEETTTKETQKISADFDNEYFNQHLKIEKITADTNLIDILTSLLLIEKPFCSLETLSILSNLTTLFITPKDQKDIETFNQMQIDYINKIYYSYLSKIKFDLFSNSLIFETSYESFETQWLVYHEDIHSTIEKLSLTPHLFLNPELCDSIEDYPFKTIKGNNKEEFKHNIIAFMALHDFCIKLNHKDEPLIKDKFPLKNANFLYEINKEVSLDPIEEKDNIIQCEVKKSVQKEYSNYIILIHLNYVMFGTPKEDNKIMIKMKIPLRLIEMYNSREDNKVLMMSIYDKGKYIEINIKFESEEMRAKVKSMLENSRKKNREWEKEQINKYFEEMINKSTINI